MEDTVAVAPEAAPSKPWPFPRRVAAAFSSPRQLFEHLAERPSWFAPFLALLLLVVVFTLVLWDPVIAPEQIAKAQEMGRGDQAAAMMNGPGKYIFPLTGALFISLNFLAWSGIVLLVGGFALGGSLSYRKSLSIVMHSALVGTVGFLVKVPLALIAKSAEVTVGPGMLFPIAQAEGFGGKFFAVFLSLFDLFNLWQTALVALGVCVVGRVPLRKAHIGIWTAFLVCNVFLALVQAVLAGMAPH